ncbi:hypothetical protein Tco_0811652 [Tanacetum coccineum]
MRRVYRTNGINKRCRALISSDNKVVSSGRSFGFAVLGQMTYLVASSTLDSARSYVMQGASCTQGTVSSIPIVGSISSEGFLSFILLLVVIIVTVVIVAVILVVVVVVIVGVVTVVTIIGIVEFLLVLSLLGMSVFCHGKQLVFQSNNNTIRSSRTGSLPSDRGMIHNELSNFAKVIPTGVSWLSGANLLGKKCQDSNIGDSDNTGNGGKIVGGAIRACGGICNSLSIASYACMTI